MTIRSTRCCARSSTTPRRARGRTGRARAVAAALRTGPASADGDHRHGGRGGDRPSPGRHRLAHPRTVDGRHARRAHHHAHPGPSRRPTCRVPRCVATAPPVTASRSARCPHAAPWAATDNVARRPRAGAGRAGDQSGRADTRRGDAARRADPDRSPRTHRRRCRPPPAPSRSPPPGGTVVVRVDGATVSLVSSTPAAGWNTTEARTDGGRVEVRFGRTGTSDQSRIEARVDNGQLRTLTE